MFWLFRKIFSLGVLAALIFLVLHVEVKGHLLKEYVIAFYESPMVQQVVSSAKESLLEMVENLEKKKAMTGSANSGLSEDSKASKDSPASKPLENLKEDEVKELEKVLKKQNKK